MFVNHSIKNVLRSSKKSVLFLILIILIVVIMSISVSLSVMIKDILQDCEENYITVAKFEYMGATYPDDTEYDPKIGSFFENFDISTITQNPAVLDWDSTQMALGYTEGRVDVNNLALLKKKAVLLVYIQGYKTGEEVYNGVVAETLYSYEKVDDLMIYVNTEGMELQYKHFYLLNCEFYYGDSAYKHVSLIPFENAISERDGLNGSIENMIIDVTNEEGGYTIPNDSYFYDIAETYRVINKCYTVQATNDIEALFPFQQTSLYLTEGRYFTEEEYNSGAKVCVMPEYLATYLNLKLGDKFVINFAYESETAKRESYWAPQGFKESIEYTIVGLTNTKTEYKNSLYIPKTDDLNLAAAHVSFVLGQTTIDNKSANQFIDDITPFLPDRVRMTVYDQGYTDVTQPLNDVMRIAIIVTCASAVVGIAIAALFGFLFIYRQRDSAKTMRRLGVETKNIFIYFLFGAGCIALTACVIGVLISAALSGVMIKILESVVQSYASYDLMYSNGSLSMVKAIQFTSNISFGVFALTAASVFVVSMISCFIFGLVSVNTHKHHRKTNVFGKARSHALDGGPLKYAWLSIIRGNFRSLIPIIVAICAVVLMFQLSFTTQSYTQKLVQMNESAEISGYYTDINGTKMNELLIRGSLLNELYQTGMIEELNVSKYQPYLYIGTSAKNGVPIELPEFRIPTGFAYETFVDKVTANARVIYTNNLEKLPEFYYSSSIVTEFLDGYNSSFLKQELGEQPYCMVSTDFMEENEVELGDTIRLIIYEGDFFFDDFLVVGSYVKPGAKDQIYCQLARYISPALLIENTHPSYLYPYVFNSVNFKLTSGAALSDFKAFLSNRGYSEVNRIHDMRIFVTIEDKTFLNMTSAISQRIWYMNNTFPVIYLLLEIIGGFAPYILIQMRKREIAMMRGQGANPKESFRSIFYEHLILSLIGATLGVLGYLLVMKTITWLGLILAVAFVGCWLGGTAISIKQINKCSVRSILKAEE